MEAADAASLAVHTQDLAKRYGKTVALSGLTMSVRRAEVFGFLGPNGAGKTTAVKLLAGLALPTAGEGGVLGAPIGDLQTRRHLGYLPELFRNSHLLSEVEQVCDRLAVVDRGRVIANGTMSQILGQDGAVRVRATGLAAAGRAGLGEFGNLEDEGEWLTFRGLSPDRVPELVSAIVRQGGRVYAVEPRHETLEDRFLQLLKGQDTRESRAPDQQYMRESRDPDADSL